MQQSLYKLKYFSLHNIAWENVIYLHSAYAKLCQKYPKKYGYFQGEIRCYCGRIPRIDASNFISIVLKYIVHTPPHYEIILIIIYGALFLSHTRLISKHKTVLRLSGDHGTLNLWLIVGFINCIIIDIPTIHWFLL